MGRVVVGLVGVWGVDFFVVEGGRVGVNSLVVVGREG